MTKQFPKSNKRQESRNGILTVSNNNPQQGMRGGSVFQDALTNTPLWPTKVRIPAVFYYEYLTSITIPNTGSAIHHFFSANGAYDPNVTGTGHQCIGFDQMMLSFEQYTVIRSKATLNYVPPGTGSSFRLSLSLSPDAVSLSDPLQLMENGLIKTSASTLTASATGLAAKALSHSCDVQSYFGRASAQDMLDDPNLYGTATSNPTEQVYYDVAGWLPYGLGGATTVSFEMFIEYDIIFWEPRKLSISLAQLLKLQPGKLAPARGQ
jgi:hypothetical protein